MKFIVDRRTWYRGKGFEKSMLLNSEDQRCCIGFVASQCGVPDEILLGAKAVHRGRVVNNIAPKMPVWMSQPGPFNVDMSTSLAQAYGANDDQLIQDEQREAEIKRIFEENGDEIEFIN